MNTDGKKVFHCHENCASKGRFHRLNGTSPSQNEERNVTRCLRKAVYFVPFGLFPGRPLAESEQFPLGVPILVGSLHFWRPKGDECWIFVLEVSGYSIGT